MRKVPDYIGGILLGAALILALLYLSYFGKGVPISPNNDTWLMWWIIING